MLKITDLFTFALALKLAITTSAYVAAQPIPDNSLGSESTSVVSDQNFNGTTGDRVDGGAVRGANLFHSFQDFAVNEGYGVYFSNPNGVINIFGRVTGSNSSKILGKLGVLGDANLFLLNPNGIIFGSNAMLDIKGSFLATTANSIKFLDTSEFNVTNSQANSLLTVSVPIGLGFTSAPSSIQVKGVGHDLTGDLYSPITSLDTKATEGLKTSSGSTLALVGGNVNFEGGIIKASSGKLEVGSVGSGYVGIISDSYKNFSLDYSKVNSFQDIVLEKQALLSSTGSENSGISIFGKNINLTDSSLIFSETNSSKPSDAININALDSLKITGITPLSKIIFIDGSQIPANGIITQNFGGRGADINISTSNLFLQSTGLITSVNFGFGLGGNINIKSLESVQLSQNSSFSQLFPLSSAIGTRTTSGAAGKIQLSTKNLNLEEGGQIFSAVYGNGEGGELSINASGSINLKGSNPTFYSSSTLSSVNFGSGKAGNLLVTTNKLEIQSGAEINSSTFATGKAGDIVINSSDAIIVNGKIPNFGVPNAVNEPSVIISSAKIASPILREIIGQFLSLPSTTSQLNGTSGKIDINTNKLSITNDAQITVNNDGLGKAGSIEINANFIDFSNGGSITAAAASGEGGDIFLRSQNLDLRRGSNITATAGGSGNGGNITINTDTLSALPRENSDISANAFMGKGGNVRITTQGLFGIAPKTLRTSLSDITASSDLGIDGVIDVKTIGFDVRNAIIPLQANFIPPEQALAGSCLARRNAEQSSFVVTGTGGLPTNPYSGVEVWDALTGGVLGQAQTIPVSQQLPNLDQQNRSNKKAILPLLEQPNSNQETLVVLRPSKWKVGDSIVEAQGIITTPDGRSLLESVPQQRKIQSPESLVCGDS